MVRRMAAITAAIFVLCARAALAADEPMVRSVRPPQTSHWLGTFCIVAGAAAIATSFELQGRANTRYDQYLAATDPDQITMLYDETVEMDRWSSGTLIGGEVLVATGIYLRFLRRPPTSRVAWSLEPGRCVVSYRF